MRFTVIGAINESCSSYLVHGFVTGVLQRKVHHGVLEGAAHVELKGDVVNTLQIGKEMEE